MHRTARQTLGAIVLLAVLLVGLGATGLVSVPFLTPQASDYDTTTVSIHDDSGTELGRVTARIADTHQKRYIGLSNTSQLPEDEGMLFTYQQEADHTYVMREMDFGIDIVYIGADHRITSIHHAEKPAPGVDGNSLKYPGRGKYVLEVPYEWTTRHDVSVGDRVRIHDE